MNEYDIVIVGGGNLGLWTAYTLAKRGVDRIAVLDRLWAGFGATSRSAGVVRQQGGSETAVTLGRRSRHLYLELGKALGLDNGFTETGYYVLAETPEEAAAFHDLIGLRRRLGVQNEWVDPAEGRRRFPALNWEMFVGATYTPDDGYVHPPIVSRNITCAVAQQDGVDLFEMCEVQGIEGEGNAFRLHTTRGDFRTERVVDAGGPRGAHDLGAMAGVDVPVHATRHQIVTYPTVHDLKAPFPMFFSLARGVYVRPEEQGALLGMSNPDEPRDESGRFQIGIDWDYLREILPWCEAMFPPIKDEPFSRCWAASIDYTPDHLPIVDQAIPGFYVLAAGGHGMMWGPGLGAAMADLITTGSSGLPQDETSLARFASGILRTDAIALPFPKA